jgi:hypothetical protein
MDELNGIFCWKMQTNFIVIRLKLLMFDGIGGTSARSNSCPALLTNNGPSADDWMENWPSLTAPHLCK